MHVSNWKVRGSLCWLTTNFYHALGLGLLSDVTTYIYSGSKTNNSWSSLVDFAQHVTQGFEKVISVIFQTAKTISKKSLTQTKASIKQTLAKEGNVIAKTIDACLPIN